MRAMPRRARLYGASRLSSWPSRRTTPADGVSRPQIALNSVVLPGAVRADQAGDEARVGVDVDVVEREVPAEAHGDAAALEQRRHQSAHLRQAESRVELARRPRRVNGRSMPTHSSGTSANSTPAASSVSGAGGRARSAAISGEHDQRDDRRRG